ncbi:DUF2057 domain-containing protein [Vibrio sp. SM6]|uniref:DUF2057 domain-containing protein n=1 Tax=Vibrio agarilyticus TaxID=2726741 RepID=A0A7X8TN60_9VIBR|nr:DUF2057 family protein [Vibrio agarilyticus]NLS11609.1 DUF2057 domain-containing protein [Vibrio agarilyticus]
MIGALALPCLASAQVTLELDDEISLIALNGEALGINFFAKNRYDLEDGINQAVVRVGKLVRKTNGEFEKFNSSPMIITFKASNETVMLLADDTIETVAQAEQFNKKPYITVQAESGNAIVTQQELLPPSEGITRDYEKEVKRYNAKRNIILKQKTIETEFSSPIIVTEFSSPIAENEEPKAQTTLHKATDAELTSATMNLLQQGYLTLNETQRKQFLSWAVAQ